VTTDEAYEHCRRITRREARNFFYGFVLLPPERRAGIYAAYAFSRRCDDSVDGDEAIDVKLDAVAERRREVSACADGLPDPDDAVLVALADAMRRFGIPRRHLDALVDGVEMDLVQARYADWPSLRAYCDRVAGAVGLVSLHIFGFRDARAPAYAEGLGVALQLVNIMRDVEEDAGRDRIYLPADEMAAFGVTEEQVLARRATAGFHDLMRAQGQRARVHFARGERLLPLLDRRARLCVATMAGLYRGILAEIERSDYAVLDGRVSLSAPRKLGVTGGALARHSRQP